MKEEIESLIQKSLKEDIGEEDITTSTLFPSYISSRGVIKTNEGGILCGIEIAKEVFLSIDKDLFFPFSLKDGKKIRENERVMVIEGDGRSILKGERTSLNFLTHLSGISTYTYKFVENVRDLNIYILDTRKTIPGLREIEKYAVKIGGGKNHRKGLYEKVLIKDNHLSLLSKDRKKAIKKALSMFKGKEVELEVESLEEAILAVENGVSIIMLDNMNEKEISETVKRIREKDKDVIIEISGNINLSNIRNYAIHGVNWISIGKITHSAPSLDFSLEIAPA